MDNTKFHRKKELETLAKEAECSILFLPAYSPDLNPIEQFWSWVKRKVREVLHNYASLDEAIQASFQLI
ncbi:MAG: transposase [Holosporales bacterium]|jgi:transposase|nr:transposase [Holosporales bacterium]